MSRSKPSFPQSQLFTLRSSRIGVQARDGYLHIVATGTLANLDEVAEYAALMSKIILDSGIKRALLDARGEQGDPSPVVRAAAWDWLRSDRSFDMVAYVVGEDDTMKAARVNMTALSMGMNLRAFVSVVEAHRFLVNPVKRPSSVFAAPIVPREASEGPASSSSSTQSMPAATSPIADAARPAGRTPVPPTFARAASTPPEGFPAARPMTRKPTLTGVGRPIRIGDTVVSDDGSGERPVYRDADPKAARTDGSTIGGANAKSDEVAPEAPPRRPSLFPRSDR